MSSRGITLVREELARVFVPNCGYAFRLRVTTKDAVMMPAHIFIHEQRLADPAVLDVAEDFVYVASPFDVTIYPTTAPTPGQYPAYFRKDQVDIVLPSTAAAEAAWAAIRDAVYVLVDAYDRLDTLTVVEETRCGAALDEPSVSDSLSS